MSLVKNRRRNMTEDESEDGALSRQAEQESIFSIKGTRNYFGKKYFYTTYMFSRHER